MYRRFALEGNVHDLLDCVPLAVRRKLDLAARKISLAGWQTLSRGQRLALCHLPVDTPDELDVYRSVLLDFAASAGVALSPLPPADPAMWSADRVPKELSERLAREG